MELPSNRVFRSIEDKAGGVFPLGGAELAAALAVFLTVGMLTRAVVGAVVGALVAAGLYALRRADEGRADYLRVLARRLVGRPIYSSAEDDPWRGVWREQKQPRGRPRAGK